MHFRPAAVFAILAAAGAYAQSLQINTPASVVQCEPVLLAWSGGTGPYFVSVLPGGQPSASPLVQFPEQNGTSLTWIVNEASGTSLGLTLRDQTGAIAQSAPFTVGSSSDSSCLSSSLSVIPGSSTSGGATTSAASATTTGSSSGTATGSSSTATGASASGSSSATTSSSSQTSNAAVPFADIGSAGIIGALVAALFI